MPMNVKDSLETIATAEVDFVSDDRIGQLQGGWSPFDMESVREFFYDTKSIC